MYCLENIHSVLNIIHKLGRSVQNETAQFHRGPRYIACTWSAAACCKRSDLSRMPCALSGKCSPARARAVPSRAHRRGSSNDPRGTDTGIWQLGCHVNAMTSPLEMAELCSSHYTTSLTCDTRRLGWRDGVGVVRDGSCYG